MAASRAPTLIWALLAFDGRISRQVFWLGNLGCAFVAVALMTPSVDPNTNEVQLGPLAPFAVIGLLWTEIALAVKRLHDRSVTGWFAVLFAVPVLGIIAFLVIGLIPGDRGSNSFAPATNTRGPA